MPSIDLSQYPLQKKISSKPKAGSGKSLMEILNTDISFGSKELPDKKKQYLYLELSALLMAGIDLKSSFELLSADYQKEKDRAFFSEIQKSVLSGKTFSNALEETGRFSLYEVFSLQIGEESGKLIEVLQDLAKFYSAKIKQQRKITSALTYPVIVLSTSFGAVFFMLKFVVPMFGDVFKRFGGHLPWITERILEISQALEHGFWWGMLILVSLSITLYTFRNTEVYRRIVSKAFLRVPILGTLIQKIYLARFCNSMRLLISAKLPLLNAIGLIRKMIRYYPLEITLKEIEKDIRRGKSLYESLQSFPIYPPKLVQLIKVGEETNQLDYFFGLISEQYVEEVEYRTSTLSSLLEPLIIIVMGLIVGLILISMYLPLFQMSNSF